VSCQVIGTCSLCGGRVTVPTVWMGIVPPDPTCGSCGAVKASHGPVIEMQPARRQQAVTSSNAIYPCTGCANGRWCPVHEGDPYQ
jgi:hypothetical protein